MDFSDPTVFDGTADTTDELYLRYVTLASHVREPVLPQEYVDRFHDIERQLDRLWHRDMAEYIEQEYRSEYRKWERGEREAAPCNCGNPRCPLLNGEIPYQLRRRSTTLEREKKEPMRALKDFLKTHPQAVVIDEALAELRDLRSETAREMTELWREVRQILDEEGAIDKVDTDEIVDDGVMISGPKLDAPGGD